MNLPPFDQPLALLTISPDGAETNGTLPENLIDLPPLDPELPASSQDLVMGMRLDDEGMAQFKEAGLMMGMSKSDKLDTKVVERIVKLIVDGPALTRDERLGANTINGSSFDMSKIPFSAPAGKNLRWTISEGDDKMLHPVHIHGCQFRILSLNGAPPAPYLTGWKDMASISNGDVCEIQVRFDELAPDSAPYMAHCHNLEHEDSGMMTQFTVA
jgi:blue copper oxidase